MERREEGYQEAVGSERIGRDKPYAFTLDSQSEDFLQVYH